MPAQPQGAVRAAAGGGGGAGGGAGDKGGPATHGGGQRWARAWGTRGWVGGWVGGGGGGGTCARCALVSFCRERSRSVAGSRVGGEGQGLGGNFGRLHLVAPPQALGGCFWVAHAPCLCVCSTSQYACLPVRPPARLPVLPPPQVPDTSIREIMLELEVAVTTVLEYHPAGGASGGGAWLAPEPLSFNILQLQHRMRGNTIPLPKALIKWVLAPSRPKGGGCRDCCRCMRARRTGAYVPKSPMRRDHLKHVARVCVRACVRACPGGKRHD